MSAPFSLLQRPLGSVPRLVLRHEASGSELDVLVGRGASLTGWRVQREGRALELLDGYDSEQDLNERYYSSHCGARLVPFPGRIKDGAWSWRGQVYQLDKNFPWEDGHAIHGLLFDVPWLQTDWSIDADGQTAWLTLECDYDGKAPGFPFPFRASSRYGLRAESFTVHSFVRNVGTTDLPYADGWHPFFRPGCPIDEAELHFGFPSLHVETDARSIPTGVQVPDDQFDKSVVLGARAINDAWRAVGPGDKACISLKNPATGLAIEYWQERSPAGGDFVQLYIPPKRESLAIEPMTCAPDVLNNNMGLQVLPPGAESALRWGATLD